MESSARRVEGSSPLPSEAVMSVNLLIRAPIALALAYAILPFITGGAAM
jgi:hypothetical protein